MGSKSEETLQVESNLISKKSDTKCFWDKIQYAFCVLSATYFIGRCVAGWVFNV